MGEREIQQTVGTMLMGLEKDSTMRIGEVVEHPDGRRVKVVDGAFLRNGRVSNWWSWREVMPDGSLGPVEQGYGW